MSGQMGLIDVERHRGKAKDKHCQPEPAKPGMAFAQWDRVIQSDRMAQTDKEKNRAPQQPSLPIEDSQRDQREENRLRNAFVILAKQCVGYVSSIQLADRKKIEGSGEEAEPCGETDRMKIQFHSGRRRSAHHRFEGLEDQRFTQFEARAISRCHRDERRFRECDDQRRDRQDKSGDGPCNSDFQQCRTMLDGRLDPYEGAHRSDKSWSWNEIGKRRLDSVISAGQVMTHFVGQ